MVNQHFGRADTFYIYEPDESGNYCLLEKRKGKPFCHGGEHEEGDLLDAVELISDCEKVFVLQIGRGAEAALAENHVEAVEARGFIEDVISQYREEHLSAVSAIRK